jgi:hypothetical protein
MIMHRLHVVKQNQQRGRKHAAATISGSLVALLFFTVILGLTGAHGFSSETGTDEESPCAKATSKAQEAARPQPRQGLLLKMPAELTNVTSQMGRYLDRYNVSLYEEGGVSRDAKKQ